MVDHTVVRTLVVVGNLEIHILVVRKVAVRILVVVGDILDPLEDQNQIEVAVAAASYRYHRVVAAL
jgi:hypothetical protein